MTGMREDLGRKLHHRQPRVDHPRRSAGETHLPGCPVYAANVTACPAECNCWPWTEGQAEQPPPASLTLAVSSVWMHEDGGTCNAPGALVAYGVCDHELTVERREVGW